MLKSRAPRGSRVSGPVSIHRTPKAPFLDLTAADCMGETFSFKQLANKITVIINVADARHQTPQNINAFKEIIQLYEECHDRGLEIVAFPSEQFGNSRTPTLHRGASGQDQLGIRFYYMENVDVNGPQQHPVYSLMKHNGSDIRGNFQTAFIVSCTEEQCTIQRFDGKPPRALRWYVEELLANAEEVE